jgi:hypothetical protein
MVTVSYDGASLDGMAIPRRRPTVAPRLRSCGDVVETLRAAIRRLRSARLRMPAASRWNGYSFPATAAGADLAARSCPTWSPTRTDAANRSGSRRVASSAPHRDGSQRSIGTSDSYPTRERSAIPPARSACIVTRPRRRGREIPQLEGAPTTSEGGDTRRAPPRRHRADTRVFSVWLYALLGAGRRLRNSPATAGNVMSSPRPSASATLAS